MTANNKPVKDRQDAAIQELSVRSILSNWLPVLRFFCLGSFGTFHNAHRFGAIPVCIDDLADRIGYGLRLLVVNVVGDVRGRDVLGTGIGKAVRPPPESPLERRSRCFRRDRPNLLPAVTRLLISELPR